MIYGYARVSTKSQTKDSNSLEEQVRELREAGAEEIFTDSFTGSKLERPEFKRLMSIFKDGDTLIVTKLDRFARSISQSSELIIDLIDRGITVNVLNLGILNKGSVSPLLRNVLLSFAEFERDMIVQRTQEGKAIAKLDPNFREGRPPVYTREQKQRAADLRKDGKTYTQIEHMTGISKSTLVRYMRYMEEYHKTGTKKAARDGLP